MALPDRRFLRSIVHPVRWETDVKTAIEPRTDALRQALASCDEAQAADLAFLEAWEADPSPGLGTALRVAQLRRANPGLAAAIRAELAATRRSTAPLLRLLPSLKPDNGDAHLFVPAS
jgi:hypothetical protein